MEAWGQCFSVERVVGLPCVSTTSTSWEGLCDSERGLGALPAGAPRNSDGAALWLVQSSHLPVHLTERLSDNKGPRTFVLGIPESRHNWLRTVRALCADGVASQAVSAVDPTGFESPQCAAPALYTKFGRTMRAKIRHTVVVQWYVVHSGAGGASLACTPFDVHRYIAAFSPLTGRKRCTWLMPPQELYPTLGAVRERQIFSQAWQQLTDTCRHLYKKGLRRRDLVARLHQTRSFIPFTGKSWLRRVYGMSKAWSFPYDQKGCLVYAVVSDPNGHVYVGQTGGRERLRSMVQRFKEHVLGGINF